MQTKYCSSCGAALMPTLRLCPACGGRSFSDQPVAVPTPAMTQTAPPSSGTMARVAAANQSISPIVGKSLPAPHGPRFIAACIDYFLLAVVSGILSLIANLAGLLGDNAPGGRLIAILAILISIGVPYAYFTVMHASDRQASWGKSLMSLTIMTLQGERLTQMQAFTRILLQSVIPVTGLVVLAMSVGGFAGSGNKGMESAALGAGAIGILVILIGPYLMVFFNPQHQSLYDRLCKTCVVRRANP